MSVASESAVFKLYNTIAYRRSEYVVTTPVLLYTPARGFDAYEPEGRSSDKGEGVPTIRG